MNALFYYLFYGFSWLIAHLPHRVIYVLSDVVAFFMHSVVKYRRQVVRQNLLNSFPNKSLNEIKRIERKFYRHFSDLFFESIMLTHSSRKRVLKMCTFPDADLLNRIYDSGKSVVVATGHYGNWELLGLVASYIHHVALGVYKPLIDKRFERMLCRSRERFGGVTVAMNDAFRTTIRMVSEGKHVLLGLITDQTPASGEIRYWTNFLNQDTPVFLGVEKIAEKIDCPVVFCKMYKVKRGRYEVRLELLCENPRSCKQYEVTNMHVKALEKLIVEQPEYWLWSHRRWKHKRNPTNA